MAQVKSVVVKEPQFRISHLDILKGLNLELGPCAFDPELYSVRAQMLFGFAIEGFTRRLQELQRLNNFPDPQELENELRMTRVLCSNTGRLYTNNPLRSIERENLCQLYIQGLYLHHDSRECMNLGITLGLPRILAPTTLRPVDERFIGMPLYRFGNINTQVKNSRAFGHELYTGISWPLGFWHPSTIERYFEFSPMGHDYAPAGLSNSINIYLPL